MATLRAMLPGSKKSNSVIVPQPLPTVEKLAKEVSKINIQVTEPQKQTSVTEDQQAITAALGRQGPTPYVAPLSPEERFSQYIADCFQTPLAKQTAVDGFQKTITIAVPVEQIKHYFDGEAAFETLKGNSFMYSVIANWIMQPILDSVVEIQATMEMAAATGLELKHPKPIPRLDAVKHSNKIAIQILFGEDVFTDDDEGRAAKEMLVQVVNETADEMGNKVAFNNSKNGMKPASVYIINQALYTELSEKHASGHDSHFKQADMIFLLQ
jgi:hypothetical protein